MDCSSKAVNPQLPGAGEVTRTLVLVVDDSEDIREALARLLRSEGYSPVGAADAFEALAFVATTRPALIITDLAMPGMDGIALVKRLKSEDHTSRIPVIMFSASGGPVVDAAMAAGVDAYVLKASMDWAKLRLDVLRLAGPGVAPPVMPRVPPAVAKDAG